MDNELYQIYSVLFDICEVLKDISDSLKTTADRKDEPTGYNLSPVDKGINVRSNSSEKPNNCEDLQDWKDRMWAEAIVTEPTISKMEQVETMSCAECKHFHENAVMYLDQCDFCFKDCKYEPKDEPQTERSSE